MGLGPLFKSIGKEAAEKLQGTAVKAESVVPALKRAGTTEEELTFSGIGRVAQDNPGAKVAKEDVVEAFQDNADDFDVVALQGKEVGYGWVAPKTKPANASYKEKIVTFGQDDRYASGHWPEGPGNYLLHTRSQNDYVGGNRSRLVMEVQSDLHQQGRKQGYSTIQPEDVDSLTDLHFKILEEARGEESSLYSAMRRIANHNVRASDEELMKKFSLEEPKQYKRMLELTGGDSTAYYRIMTDFSRKAQANSEAEYNAAARKYAKELSAFGIDASKEAVNQALMEAGKIPKSPWEKTWLKKGLELELGDAVSQGLDNITVPIGKEAAKGLQRGAGVQKWYEANVVDTMRKIAKQQGATFELVDEATTEVLAARELLKLVETDKPISEGLIDKLKETGYTLPKDINRVIGFGQDKAESIVNLWSERSELIRKYNRESEFVDYNIAVNRADAEFSPKLKEAGYADAQALYDDYKGLEDLAGALNYFEHVAKEDHSFARITMPRTMSKETMQKVDTLEHNVITSLSDDVVQDEAHYSYGVLLKKYGDLSKEELTKKLYDYMKAEFGFAGESLSKHVQNAVDGKRIVYNFDEQLAANPEIGKLADELGVKLDEFTWPETLESLRLSNKIKKPSFTLYSVAPATIISAYAAKQQGYTDEELQAYLGDEYDEVAEQLPKVEEAAKAGYSEQEIMQFLGNAPTAVTSAKGEYAEPPFGPNARSEMLAGEYGKKLEVMAKLTDTDTEMSLPEIVAALEVVYPNMRSVTLRTAGFFGNKDAARMSEEATIASAQRIVNFVSDKYNLPLEYNADTGEYLLNGVEVTPSILDNITATGGELTGAITGGTVGAIYGKKFGGNLGALAGSLGGAVLGSVAGTELDYIRHAMELQADMSGEVAAHKALTAAEASIIGDMIGIGAFKIAGKSWQGMKRVKDFIVDGNSEGAYTALKQIVHVTDEEADEYIKRLQSVIKGEIPGNTQAQKRITATLMQKPGAEFLVYAASELSPKAATRVTADVTARANQLNGFLKELTPKTTGERAIQDLGNYTTDVKNFYEGVKIQAASAPRANNFKFNYDNIAINPVLEKMRSEITDPVQMERFVLQAQRIRGMSDARSFGDLLELRTIVNGFRRKPLTKATSEALEEVMTRIDGAIDVGAGHILGPEADLWKANWQAAKQQYAKMKSLEKNVLFKALTRPGTSEDVIATQLVKYSQSIDSTFDDVINKLPKQSRANVEKLMLDKLTDKFTAGVEGGMQAVNFTELDKAMRFITFKDPQARQMRAAIGELSEVFRNDFALVNLNRSIDIPKFQQMLTDSLWGKLKYGIASELYTAVRSRLPGETGRNAALVRQAAKFLQEPLNMKEMKELMDMSADAVDISPSINQLQQEIAAKVAKERDDEAVLIKLYGEGAVKKFKGIGASSSIPMHRVATQDLARQVADQEGFLYSNTKELEYSLKQRGYLGIMQGTDRVRVFK